MPFEYLEDIDVSFVYRTYVCLKRYNQKYNMIIFQIKIGNVKWIIKIVLDMMHYVRIEYAMKEKEMSDLLTGYERSIKVSKELLICTFENHNIECDSM